jgi:hypothetical protein
MNPTRRTALAATLVVALAPAAAGQQPAPPSPDTQSMLAMAVERAKPGPEHKLLESLAGSWRQEVSFSVPGFPALRHGGTTNSRLILGGRFLECDSAGAGPARAFEAVTIYGYDTRKKQYFAVGMDTTGSYYIHPFGRYDAATKSLILEGDEIDETGSGTFHYRWIVRIEGADRHVIEVIFEFPGREPMRIMEIVHTRKEG